MSPAGRVRELDAALHSKVRREEMMNSANEQRFRLGLCMSCTAIAAMFLCGKALAQAAERPDLSIELIDPKVFRVCADPNNMPFSTDKAEGFENKLAELLAGKLGKGLSYRAMI